MLLVCARGDGCLIRMWLYPPDPPGYDKGALPSPDSFFRSCVFVWHPVGVWRCSLKCPRGDNCVGKGRNVHLYKSGYHHHFFLYIYVLPVRHICDVSSWYTMLTEVLSCGPCTKAARSGEGGTVGRWLAWDPAILSQLSEAHRAMFPAILTSSRGLPTPGLVELRGIISTLGHTFQAPPPPRELPSARLLRDAFLLAEANNVQDYRSQILSISGTVLKIYSTKKVVKKLSGEGQGSAEWFTSIGNEHSQIPSYVLTCEESTEKLDPMCRSLMERFRLANQPVPKILYVDRGCCPIRTESHSTYAAFKSALAGAVLAYNRTELELLVKAVRAKDPAAMKSVSDEDVVRNYVSKEQLKHVRRVTLGVQETFRLVSLAIEELKRHSDVEMLFYQLGTEYTLWCRPLPPNTAPVRVPPCNAAYQVNLKIHSVQENAFINQYICTLH
ncbi:hypothetical protein Q7C36_004507 [Tachysurus vachellii]|uniref:DUF6729 domain-containing protein n=1 Tax=Tachysurus vachellii TaxID=175792 RepID=A0AA88T2S5_TACVA|nr:hypothetical protein Q7C36_004507 [Tachysurus vachellii]